VSYQFIRIIAGVSRLGPPQQLVVNLVAPIDDVEILVKVDLHL